MPLKLTRETIETFNVPLSINILPNDKTNKVNINNVSINSQQYILAAVCVLEPNDNNSEIEIVTHGKANALHHLLHHTSGLWGLNRVQKTNFILHCSTMVRSCPFIVFSLKYPKKTTVLDDPCSILSVHICQINGYKLGKEQE